MDFKMRSERFSQYFNYKGDGSHRGNSWNMYIQNKPNDR